MEKQPSDFRPKPSPRTVNIVEFPRQQPTVIYEQLIEENQANSMYGTQKNSVLSIQN
jgi:hypothetical protein